MPTRKYTYTEIAKELRKQEIDQEEPATISSSEILKLMREAMAEHGWDVDDECWVWPGQGQDNQNAYDRAMKGIA